MKARAILIVLALGAAPSLAAADQAWREQSRRVESAEGLTALVVDNARGRIDVRPSADGKLHITALKIARASTVSEAKKIAQSASVEVAREGSRYVVKVKYPRKESVHVNLRDGFDLSVPRLEVRLAAEVPATLAVQLNASSGDLYTQDLRGEQRLRASSGMSRSTAPAVWWTWRPRAGMSSCSIRARRGSSPRAATWTSPEAPPRWR
jgi:hypothetical protein